MINEADLKFFDEMGYLVVPNVLTDADLQLMRKRIKDIFSSGEYKVSPFNTDRVLSDVYNAFPEFIDITLNEKILGMIKQVLGDKPVLMPETAIHHKWYTGWHKDTTTQEKMGYTFHHQPESLMIECGFYLQDNDELGGGLTVMEGSHKTTDLYTKPRPPKSLSNRIATKILGDKDPLGDHLNPNHHKIVDIDSKAGDMVIFNFKTNHRATFPRTVKPEEVPEEKSKIAFFNAFSVNNSTANEYLEFILNRPEPFYQNLKTRKLNENLLNKAKQLDFTVI